MRKIKNYEDNVVFNNHLIFKYINRKKVSFSGHFLYSL